MVPLATASKDKRGPCPFSTLPQPYEESPSKPQEEDKDDKVLKAIGEAS